jgi:ABC-2 type transport system permease protein
MGLGWRPRIAAVVAWAAVGYCAIVALFGDSFELPAWFQSASPFTHTPEAPLEGVTAAPLLAIGTVVVLLRWAASPGSAAATWATDGAPAQRYPRHPT